jgi:4-amino-4-deoxychorismate mutase
MSAGLEPFRRRLDELDEQIARLLGERFEVCRDVARYKTEHDIVMMQPARVAEVRARYLARGADVDLPEDFTADLFDLIIAATCRMEDELMGTPEHRRGDPVAQAGEDEDEVISRNGRAGRT